MEDFPAAPPPRHRARRHRRKASDSATYGDVFDGGPRFAPPLAGAPADYADVFGGVAASCSIPYLDLPPAPARTDGGAGRYGEIFTRVGFGEYMSPYEDMFAEAEGMADEIESWSASSSPFNAWFITKGVICTISSLQFQLLLLYKNFN
ncbi:Auxilin-related protein 1 [Hordeum vulgare]|nr:Auxilin-related protein 1 [Hordeum vulgare]